VAEDEVAGLEAGVAFDEDFDIAGTGGAFSDDNYRALFTSFGGGSEGGSSS